MIALVLCVVLYEYYIVIAAVSLSVELAGAHAPCTTAAAVENNNSPHTNMNIPPAYINTQSLLYALKQYTHKSNSRSSSSSRTRTNLHTTPGTPATPPAHTSSVLLLYHFCTVFYNGQTYISYACRERRCAPDCPRHQQALIRGENSSSHTAVRSRRKQQNNKKTPRKQNHTIWCLFVVTPGGMPEGPSPARESRKPFDDMLDFIPGIPSVDNTSTSICDVDTKQRSVC